MTADRMRAAADRLDEWYTTFHGTTHLPGFVLANWQVEVALLRVVADRPHDFGVALQAWLFQVDGAAAAVADTILGDTDD